MKYLDELREWDWTGWSRIDRTFVVLLALFGIALAVQLLPWIWAAVSFVVAGGWGLVWELVDVRKWTWRSYAVAAAIGIVELLWIHVEQNREG